MPSIEEEACREKAERDLYDAVDDDLDANSEDDDEDDEDEDDDDDDDEMVPVPVAMVPLSQIPSTTPSAAGNPNPNTLTAPAFNGGGKPIPQPIASAGPLAVAPSTVTVLQTPPTIEERRQIAVATAGFDDSSRRLFQRLWTDEDELVILQGFLEFISQRGTMHASHQHDTGPFYEQIKARLQLDFTKNQLIEKLRRLKKKFRNVVSRINRDGRNFAYKSPHEQFSFEISRKIWTSALKRSREIDEEDDVLSFHLDLANEGADDGDAGGDPASRRRRRRRRAAATATATAIIAIPAARVPVEAAAPAVVAAPPKQKAAAETAAIKETVKNCLSPLFKELIGSAVGGCGLGNLAPPPPLELSGDGSLAAAGDEKWRKQKIMELEVYLKRVELVQETINKSLEELRAAVAPPPPPATTETGLSHEGSGSSSLKSL